MVVVTAVADAMGGRKLIPNGGNDVSERDEEYGSDEDGQFESEEEQQEQEENQEEVSADAVGAAPEFSESPEQLSASPPAAVAPSVLATGGSPPRSSSELRSSIESAASSLNTAPMSSLNTAPIC